MVWERMEENSSLTDENNQLGSSDQIDDGLIDIDDSANNEIVRIILLAKNKIAILWRNWTLQKPLGPGSRLT